MTQTDTKIKRAGVFLSIHEKTTKDGSLEFRLMRGNKILSRHRTNEAAMAAWDAHKARPAEDGG